MTPAYNAAPYLAACIESVLGQSFADIEMLVVDDGSTDRTSEVLTAFAARDARVRGFRGPNRGVSHARNVALRHARGRFVALLDADDEWDPLFLEEQLAIVRRHPDVAIVTGNALNAGGGTIDGQPVRPWPAQPRELRFIDLIEHEDAMFIMSLVRREVFEAVGGFNEGLERSEDYELWLRAAAVDLRIVTNPKPLGRYRRRHDSATADQMALFESLLRVLDRARTFRERPRAAELAAIDRQRHRLHASSLLLKGKQALLRGQFVEARSHFRELHHLGKGERFRLVASALQLAPTAVRALYRFRLWLLQRRVPVDRRAVPGIEVPAT
ncbi:MAG: glycosyltransferase family 2 protein [Vicinamibacterales bacterium]